MGDKYMPSIKDQKAAERFQKQALGGSKFMKSPRVPPEKRKAEKPKPGNTNASPASDRQHPGEERG